MTKEYKQADLIEAIVNNILYDVHTMIPAKIVKVDSYEEQRISVQPLIKERNRDYRANAKGLTDMAVITGVPVLFPSAGTGIITFPIKVGDPVMLMFSETSIDNFLFSDSKVPVDPEDFRRHDYNDVVALAGLYSFPKALGIDPDDVVIRMNVGTDKESKVSLKPSGDVVVDTPTKFIVNAKSNIELNTQADAQVVVKGNADISVSGSTTLTSNGTIVNSELTVNGNTTFNGNTTTNGNQSVSGNSTASDHISGGKSGKNHTHGGVTSGGAQTAPPT